MTLGMDKTVVYATPWILNIILYIPKRCRVLPSTQGGIDETMIRVPTAEIFATTLICPLLANLFQWNVVWTDLIAALLWQWLSRTLVVTLSPRNSLGHKPTAEKRCMSFTGCKLSHSVVNLITCKTPQQLCPMENNNKDAPSGHLVVGQYLYIPTYDVTACNF